MVSEPERDREAAALAWQQGEAWYAAEGPKLRPHILMPAPLSGPLGRAFGGFSLKVEVSVDEETPRARIVFAEGPRERALPWSTLASFRAYVDAHRDWFGIPADRTVRLVASGSGARLRYPNGAVSENAAYFKGRSEPFPDAQNVSGGGLCFSSPTVYVVNELPVHDPAFLAPPAIDGEAALTRFREVAPYASLRPIEAEDGTANAATLVVFTLRTGESRLGWRIGYRYACNDGTAPEAIPFRESEAHVDAVSGVIYWPPQWPSSR